MKCQQAGVLVRAGACYLPYVDVWEAEADGTGGTNGDSSISADVASCDPMTVSHPTMGIYAGAPSFAGPFGGSEWEEASTWLGRPVVYGGDFLSGSIWHELTNPMLAIERWERWIRQGSNRRAVFHVALLPESGNSSLAAGAQGDYSEHFGDLARQLATNNLGDSILRIGGVFNTGAHRYSAVGQPENYAAFFRNVVEAMRGGDEDSNFEFVWNPRVGESEMDSTKAYPGDEYVDYIGLDIFDRSEKYPYPTPCDESCRREVQAEVWQEKLTGSTGTGGGHGQGLRFWSDFARKHGKPLAVTDWGVIEEPGAGSGGDNPYFVEKMHEFIYAPKNRVAFHVVFTTTSPQKYYDVIGEDSMLPDSAAALKAHFGGEASCP